MSTQPFLNAKDQYKWIEKSEKGEIKMWNQRINNYQATMPKIGDTSKNVLGSKSNNNPNDQEPIRTVIAVPGSTFTAASTKSIIKSIFLFIIILHIIEWRF